MYRHTHISQTIALSRSVHRAFFVFGQLQPPAPPPPWSPPILSSQPTQDGSLARQVCKACLYPCKARQHGRFRPAGRFCLKTFCGHAGQVKSVRKSLPLGQVSARAGDGGLIIYIYIEADRRGQTRSRGRGTKSSPGQLFSGRCL